MKQIRYLTYLILIGFISTEIGVRMAISFYMGPRMLFYGTRFKTYIEETRQREHPAIHTVKDHENIGANYTKYFPNEHKVDHTETGEVFSVRINRDGFRGKDFSEKKEKGVVRILTLGASSTFGYSNRDSTTYPAYMEQLLNENCLQGTSYEVINLGIPHLKSENILALFLTEGVELDPDIVTFYAGINDSALPIEKGTNLPYRIFSLLSSRLLTFRCIEYLNEQRQRMNYDYDEGYAELRSRIFLQNLSQIYEETRKRGILLIVGNQQAKSRMIKKGKIKGVTYQEEAQIVRERIINRAGGGKYAYFLIHARIMADLKEWASENQIPFVDIIEDLNPMRHLLVSWVHLNPEANKWIASIFTEEIFKHSCQN